MKRLLGFIVAVDLTLGLLGRAWITAAAADPAQYAAASFSSAAYCPQGCETLRSWLDATVVPDARLRGALAFAYSMSSETWREAFALPTVLRGTRVVFGPPDNPGNLGYFSPLTNTITVSETLANEPTDELATILEHEIVHAGLDTGWLDTRTGAEQCFQQEIIAYGWQASFWGQVRQYDDQTTLAQSFDGLATMWRSQTIASWVLTDPNYQNECFGSAIQ